MKKEMQCWGGWRIWQSRLLFPFHPSEPWFHVLFMCAGGYLGSVLNKWNSLVIERYGTFNLIEELKKKKEYDTPAMLREHAAKVRERLEARE